MESNQFRRTVKVTTTFVFLALHVTNHTETAGEGMGLLSAKVQITIFPGGLQKAKTQRANRLTGPNR
jgi:hypothetical protein